MHCDFSRVFRCCLSLLTSRLNFFHSHYFIAPSNASLHFCFYLTLVPYSGYVAFCRFVHVATYTMRFLFRKSLLHTMLFYLDSYAIAKQYCEHLHPHSRHKNKIKFKSHSTNFPIFTLNFFQHFYFYFVRSKKNNKRKCH